MAEEQQQDAQPQDAGAGETPDFETWLGAQPEAVQAAYAQHTSKLKNALDEERTTRKTLAKQFADLTKQAQAGADLKPQLEKLSADFAATSRQRAFYEAAPNEITNRKLAWLAATDAGLVDNDGECDWKALRNQAPELFGKTPLPTGHAGTGAGQSGSGGATMNDFIRRSAGRGG